MQRASFCEGQCELLANYYRDGDEQFILKDIPRNNYEFRLEVYQRLGSCPYVRDLEDTCADESIFVFKYLKVNLLVLVQKNLPIATTKKILRDALRGLAAMHDKDIVHNGITLFYCHTARQWLVTIDIKPNNILVEAVESPHGITIQQTQLTDLEDSAHFPPPRDLIGATGELDVA